MLFKNAINFSLKYLKLWKDLADLLKKIRIEFMLGEKLAFQEPSVFTYLYVAQMSFGI